MVRTHHFPTAYLLAGIGILSAVGAGHWLHMAHQSKTPTVIFDLDGVLFQTHTGKALKQLGRWSVISYALRGHNPAGLKDKAFDILHKTRAGTQATTAATYQGKAFAPIMEEWQRGSIHYQEIMQEVLPVVEKLDQQGYFANKKEKELIVKILHLMFNPEQLAQITRPIKRGVQLLRECKQKGCRVLILSNMDPKAMQLLAHTYQDIFSLCDGIIYSGEIAYIKPEKQIYTYLLTKHQLNPEQCAFLDNQQENIAAAKKLGIMAIHCTSGTMRIAKNTLKDLGILDGYTA